MRLSAPVHRLKRKARLLSREAGIPLHEALDLVARKEGFHSWSLLAVRASQPSDARELFAQLEAGDLLLLGARRFFGEITRYDAPASVRQGYTLAEARAIARRVGQRWTVVRKWP